MMNIIQCVRCDMYADSSCNLIYSTPTQFEDIKFSHKPCDLCLGNVHNAAKHCKTCKASFCVNHMADHYKSPALTKHDLVNLKQMLSVASASESSFHWRKSGTA